MNVCLPHDTLCSRQDLIPVKFTLLEPEVKASMLVVKKARYKCPITSDVLCNSTPCAVLRPSLVLLYSLDIFTFHLFMHNSGDVVTLECVEKLIYPNDMICPITGIKLKDSDIISLARVSQCLFGLYCC